MKFSFAAFFSFLYSVSLAWREDRPMFKRDVRMVILRQIFFTGQQAFRLIVYGAIIFSVITVAQSASQLTRFGGIQALGPIIVGAFFREIGPLFVLVVVIARSVSAMASELSAMKANGEIEGLRGMGVSPLSYLVFPRVVSGAVSVFLLGVHFVWISLLVGYFVVQGFANVPWSRYWDLIVSSIEMKDLAIFFFKTFVNGALVFLLACYCGLRTTGALFEIPQATTKAVVWSFMLCFSVQLGVSGIYYLQYFQRSGLIGAI